jgi:hypothetical protein
MYKNNSLFNEFVCKLVFFWHEWTSFKREWNECFKGPRVPKKAQFTHERIEYNVFLFDERFKGSKSLKIFKIRLTFRFDRLWHLSKFIVEQKILFLPKNIFFIKQSTLLSDHGSWLIKLRRLLRQLIIHLM